MFSCRPSPLRARPPLPMGEMQGALTRARLESLLRPRHKKRAEAQKRSESFLLTGLGKRRCRHAETCLAQSSTSCSDRERGWVSGAALRMGPGKEGGRSRGTTLTPKIRA